MLNRGDDANEMGDNLEFVDLGTGVTVLQVALGAQHGCAVIEDGLVKCWGETKRDKGGGGTKKIKGGGGSQRREGGRYKGNDSTGKGHLGWRYCRGCGYAAVRTERLALHFSDFTTLFPWF